MASPSTSTDNFFRLAKLLARLSPRVLRKLFKQEALSGPENTIDEFLHNHQSSILSLQRRKILHQSQIDLIFPAGGNTDIADWDLTLLTCLLRNLFTFSAQEKDDLDTLRTAKNEIYSHTSDAEIDNIQFNHLWNAIEPATMSLAALLNDNAFFRVIQSDIQSTKTGPLTVGDRTSVDILRMWAEKDRKLEQQLGVLVEHTTGQIEASDRIERVSACLVDAGAYALRPVLEDYIHKSGFASMGAFLTSFENSIRNNLSAKLDIVFPDDGSPTDQAKWDVSIYFTLLFRICNISGSVDTHLRKLRLQRDNLYSERERQTFNDASFERYFDNIQRSLKALLPGNDVSHVTALEEMLDLLRAGTVLTNDASSRLVDWYNFDQQMTRYNDDQVVRDREQLAERLKSDIKTDEASGLQVNLVITGDSEEDESCVYGCMQALKTGLTTLTGQLAAFHTALSQHGNRIIGVERSSVDIAIECVSPGGLLHVWNIYDSGQLADRFEAVLRELREETGREMALQITCKASEFLHTLHMSETIGEEGRGQDAAAPLLVRKATQPEVCSVHKEPLTLYCKNHEEVICMKCVSELHRTCDVDTERSASEEIQAAYEIKLEELKRERDRLRQSEIDSKRHIEKLKRDKETALKSAEHYRSQVIEAIHREEETVQNTFRSETEKLSKREEFCYIEIKSLDTAETELKTAREKGTDKELAAALKKSSEQIMKSVECVPTDVDVKPIQTRLEELKESIADAIGMVTKASLDSSIRPKKTIELKDQILTKVATYKVRQPDDEGVCRITGCQFLPSGRLVMCDEINEKLKLLDTDTGLVTSITLEGRPLDVAVVSATEVVVALLFSDMLQFVTVEPELKVVRRIRVGRHGRLGHGVAYHDQTLYVRDWDSDGEIVVLSLDGKLLRRLPIHVLPDPLWPGMVRLAVDRHGRIYVSKEREDAVTCIEQKGAPVYTYKDEDLRGAGGFFVDSSQNVYVCGQYSRNIHAITAEGIKARTMLTARDGLHHPTSIAYRDGDRTLAVGQCDDDILVFRAVSSK